MWWLSCKWRSINDWIIIIIIIVIIIIIIIISVSTSFSGIAMTSSGDVIIIIIIIIIKHLLRKDNHITQIANNRENVSSGLC